MESLNSVLRSRKASWAKDNDGYRAVDYFGGDGSDGSATPEMYAQRAVEMAAQGFTALKFDIGVPNPFPSDPHNRSLSNQELDYMLSLIAAVRGVVGYSVDIAVDCHWRFNLADARRIAEYADSYNLAVAPHRISSPVGTLASAHFCAATPNFIALEYQASEVPFLE